jgi:hypothetical protein
MTFRAPFAPKPSAIAAVAICGLLAACSTGREAVGDALGLSVESPNPFNVAPRAPLRLPSDLSALPPPQPGAPSPLDPQPEQSARAALALSSGTAAAAAPGPGERRLLEAAGADLADPTIRATLAEETPQREQRYGLTSILGYKIPDGSEEEILDPRQAAEEARETGAATPNPPPAEPEPRTDKITIPLGG